MSRKAGWYNIEVLQGATFLLPLKWKAGAPLLPINVTGYSAKLQVRENTSSVAALLEMSSVNGRIVIGGIDGMITPKLTALETAALSFRRGVYDLELTEADGVTVRRLLEGQFVVKPEVTR